MFATSSPHNADPEHQRGPHLVLRERIGQGGFGVVYRAIRVGRGGIQRPVAVKVLHPHRALDAEALLREGHLLAALQHPAILGVHEVVRIRRRQALVTDWIDGADLATLLWNEALPPRVVVQVVGAVAAGLATAALEGLVHRDVKPANIVVGRFGSVVLIDWGLASNASAEAPDRIVGSLPYMAPEQLHAPEAIGPAADVYALGCALYEGLMRRRLFASASISGPAVRLRQTHPDEYGRVLNKALMQLDHGPERRLLASLLDRDPGQRPTAAALAADCERWGEMLDGPSLQQWAVSRSWPRTVGDAGPLTGWVVGLNDEDGGRYPAPGPIGALADVTLATASMDIAAPGPPSWWRPATRLWAWLRSGRVRAWARHR